MRPLKASQHQQQQQEQQQTKLDKVATLERQTPRLETRRFERHIQRLKQYNMQKFHPLMENNDERTKDTVTGIYGIYIVSTLIS